MEEIDKLVLIVEELRTERKLSKEELSEEIGITPSTLFRWKNGYTPKVQSLKRLSDYFECSIDFLLGYTDNPQRYPAREPETFLCRYQLLKKEKGIKDIDIAQKLKLGSGTPSKWKEGRIPDTVILIELCKIFGCSFEFLIGRDEY